MSLSSYYEGWWDRITSASLVPGDVVGVWLLLAAAYLVAFFAPGSTAAVPVAVLVTFLLPGYVLVAALAPYSDGAPSSLALGSDGPRLNFRERIAASIAVSIALAPLFGLLIAALPAGFTTTTVLNTFAVFLIVVGIVATIRRARVPAENRYAVPIGDWFGELRAGLATGSRTNRVLTLALVCSIVLAAGVATFAVATPISGESYTDFHLVTEDDGEYVSANYPETVLENESVDLAWGVHNFEGKTTDYTVVVTLERVADSDGEQRTVESTELYRESVTVGPNERTVVDHEISPPFIGEDLRLNYYLYRNGAPDDPSRESAYRDLHIWIDVESA